MYQNMKEEKCYYERESPEKMKYPEFQTKAYSFTDPLFQSFGNNKPEGVKNVPNLQKRSVNFTMDRFSVHESGIEFELFSELEEFSDRINLMSRMLKINKPITNSSVLMVNSQNKMKTVMLIESKRLNNDENSKILCENASKYLTFLEVLNQLENSHEEEINIHKNERHEENKNWESRKTKENEAQKRQNERRFEDERPLKLSDLDYHNYYSSKDNISHLEKDSNEYFSNDNSTHLRSNPKTTNFSSGLSTAEKMFQGIKTPQNNIHEHSLIFTPLRQQNRYHEENSDIETEGKKTKNNKSPLSSAVLQVKKDIKKPNEREILTFNKKSETSRTKSPLINPKVKKTENSRSKSKSKSQKEKETLIKKEKASEKDLKEKNKNRSFTNFESMIDSKNLAYKTLNKTNQFDKMLKMASSRMNPV